MIFPIYPWMYAFVFIILLLVWPFYVVNDPTIFSLCVIINTGIFLTVAWFTSSRELNFWRGFRLLCASYSTGCANITIIYIFPVLLFYYIQMIGATWRGIQRGKSYTENWWIKTISKRFQAESWNISDNNSTHHSETDDRGDDVRFDLTIGFYEAIFGCEKEITVSHLKAEPDGNLAQVPKKFKIHVPAGVNNGTRLHIAEEGDAGQRGRPPGDLYIYLFVNEDDEFQRDGINIMSDLTITAEQARLGGEVSVNTIDGERKLIIPPETNSGDHLTCVGYGVPMLGSPTNRGDHIIRIVF